MYKLIAFALAAWLITLPAAPRRPANPLRAIPLKSSITRVQPLTGMMMWETDYSVMKPAQLAAVQLEYVPFGYNEVVSQKGLYKWEAVEKKLNAIAGRQHQAVIRFYDTMPGQPTTVPDYIKLLPNYVETKAQSEGKDTFFPDWSHPAYQAFILDFFKNLAGRYDGDKRLAYLQVGFGLWSEYHIYSGPEVLGKTFPSKEFQTQFLKWLPDIFRQTPWMISQDAKEASRTPFSSQPELLKLRFGVFDDTFDLAWDDNSSNFAGWKFFALDRWKQSPTGGEIPGNAGINTLNQLQISGWKDKTRRFGITYMLAGPWLRQAKPETALAYGMACGYRFQVTAFSASAAASRVVVQNTGIAPIYYDAFITVNGVRSKDSLRGLLPNKEGEFNVSSGGQSPKLSIESDRLVTGQRIEFEASLP